MKNHREILVAIGCFTLLSLVIMFQFLLGKTIYFGDNYYLMLPQKIFLVEQLKQGVVPFWNPYNFSGVPFLADINHAPFYPSTLLFLC